LQEKTVLILFSVDGNNACSFSVSRTSTTCINMHVRVAVMIVTNEASCLLIQRNHDFVT